MTSVDYNSHKYIKVVPIGDFVYNVQLNREKQRNAINLDFWLEFGQVFKKIDVDPDCRVVVLTANGPTFSAGLDLKSSSLTTKMQDDSLDVARKGHALRRTILKMQESFNRIEECTKPVIAAVHGFCVGAGVDLIAACDVRLASADATFSIREARIGLAADMGSLNRLPKMVSNHSWLRDVALTARDFDAKEALQFGLISGVFADRNAVRNAAIDMAKTMAKLSPVAVQGTKMVMNHARDHTVRDSLEFVTTWNMSQLLGDDLATAAVAAFSKDPNPPTFSKL